MEKIKEFVLRKKYYVIGILVLLISLFVFFFSINKNNEVEAYILEDETTIEENQEEEKIEDEKEENCLVKVDIKGYVNNPGMYEVDCEARVNDVISVAGGLKKGADTTTINLSKKVSDQMVIVVSSEEELKKVNECVVKQDTVKENPVSTSTPTSTPVPTVTSVPTINVTNDADITSCINMCLNPNVSSDNKISLNNATKEELMTLTGIGESKAIAIIKYREDNGGFKKIEDIMNVSGIGEKAFEKIKDNLKL